MLSDRFCIFSYGADNEVLSPQQLVSCDDWNFGCQGGNLIFAMEYLESTGVVADTCMPYTSADGEVAACPK